MKQILITLVFLMLLLSMWASALEDGIKDMFTIGQYTYMDGDKVFMSSTYWSDKGYGEEGAYNFATLAGFYFLAVHHEWDSMSDSNLANGMKSTDSISCPWSNGYGAALLTIRLSAIYDEFGYNSYEEMGEDDLLEAIETFIHRNGDRTALTFEEEEEDY